MAFLYMYGYITCCKFSNIRTLYTKTNSEYPDQTASEEAVWSGSSLFVIHFMKPTFYLKTERAKQLKFLNIYRIKAYYFSAPPSLVTLQNILKEFLFEYRRNMAAGTTMYHNANLKIDEKRSNVVVGADLLKNIIDNRDTPSTKWPVVL